jgi:hypothetical protein
MVLMLCVQFKATVTLTMILDEKEQDEYLEKWSQLYDEVATEDGPEEESGRKIVETTCIILTQNQLRVGETSNMVFKFEDFCRDTAKQNGYDGKQIFDKIVRPASKLMLALHNGKLPQSFSENCSEKEMMPQLDSIVRFLFRLSESMSEMRQVLFYILFRYEKFEKKDPKMLCILLKKLELKFLHVALLPPSGTNGKKIQMCHQMLDELGKDELSDYVPLQDQKHQEIINVLRDPTIYGKKTNIKKYGNIICKSVLLRLNENALHQNSQADLRCNDVTLEHILPKTMNAAWQASWNDTDKQNWLDRLGNYAVLNRKSNTKAGNRKWSKKVEELEQSPFPLTREIAKEKNWTVNEVQRYHEKRLKEVIDFWGLQAK